MKDFIKNKLKDLLLESKNTYQYQVRNIGGADVYYKRKDKDKKWVFIDKEEFDKKSNKDNTVKYKKDEKDNKKTTSGKAKR